MGNGQTRVRDPHANFSGRSNDVSNVVDLGRKLILSGWSNVNYVLNDVKNPIRTLKEYRINIYYSTLKALLHFNS